jgi:hypothetical protein
MWQKSRMEGWDLMTNFSHKNMFWIYLMTAMIIVFPDNLPHGTLYFAVAAQTYMLSQTGKMTYMCTA